MTKVNGRRLNGEGTLYKVDGRDLWQGRVQVDGRRVKVYGKTRSEARNKMMEIKRRIKLGATAVNNETVSEYFERWYTSGNIRQSTIDARLFNIRRMNPHIGTVKLAELKPQQIHSMYKSLRKKLSDRSVKQAHAVLSKALKDAIKEGTIIANPIDRMVEIPKVTLKEINPLTRDEVKRLLSINTRWTPLFTVLVHTGLRKGEALALTWDNVDLDRMVEGKQVPVDNPTLKVTKTLQFTTKGKSLGKPKTDSSRREIPLSSSVVQALLTHRTAQNELRLSLGKGWNDNNIVFPNTVGEFMSKRLPNENLTQACKAAGIDRNVRVHDLRHTCGSLMHQNGVSAKDISTILGHKSIQITLDLYVHTNTETLRQATDILDQVISV